jgi:predicted nuclease of predicted toxin-antitoxin system
MKLLLDMNFSPDWVPFLSSCGFLVEHWSQVGAHDAPDRVVMDHARQHGMVVMTHDLDFGIALALAGDRGPSVVQIRGGAVLPEDAGESVADVLRATSSELEQGALVTIDRHAARIRILPIHRTNT